VIDAGADPTGASSSVAAFNLVISAANAISTQESGFLIQIPPGIYNLDANLTPITAGGVYIQSTRAANLSVSATGALWTWTGGQKGGGLLGGLTVTYPSAPNGGASVFTISSFFDMIFEGLMLDNINTLAVLGTSPSLIASAITFSDPIGGVYNGGHSTFDCRWGSDLIIHNGDIFVANVPVPVFNRVSTMTTVANTNFLNFTNGGWDAVILSGGTRCNRYWSGVYVNAPGAVIENFTLDGSFFDYCSSDAVSLNAATNAAGGIFNIFCRDCYIVSWSGNGILLTGNNQNTMHDFSGSHVYIAGLHGVHLSGPATHTIDISGMLVSQPNRLNGGTSSGYRIDTIAGDWTCIGSRCLTDPSGAFPWDAYYGFDLVAGNIKYVVTGCTMHGTQGNYNIPLDASFSTERVISGNNLADYVGFQTSASFTKPSSGQNWQNVTPWNVTVTMDGMTGIGFDAANFFSLTGGAWLVPPGHSIFVTYSGTNHMQFFVHP
jgi:hypothetical protein